MSLAAMDRLGGDAKTWIFGAARPFDEHADTIRATMERFIDEWTAHGADLPASFELIDDRFLVVAADDTAQPGGCSIDRLFKLMQQFERELGIAMLDSTLVFYRDASGSVRSVTRPEFRELAAAGEVSASTIVFDTSIDRITSYREGAWQRPAAESWHGAAFGLK